MPGNDLGDFGPEEAELRSLVPGAGGCLHAADPDITPQQRLRERVGSLPVAE